jgi:transcriptional regulator with XRE-family HTH domain
MERAVTQEAFANGSGFDRGYISGIERGVRNPSALVPEKIAKALDADVVELLDPDKANEFRKTYRSGQTA